MVNLDEIGAITEEFSLSVILNKNVDREYFGRFRMY